MRSASHDCAADTTTAGLAAYDGSGVALASVRHPDLKALAHTISRAVQLRELSGRCSGRWVANVKSAPLVGLHVNDCTMFTLDVAHIGGDFPLERRSISIRHGFVKERERYKLLNIGAFHAARFPDTSRLREIILQHPGCHRRKGRENSGQITSKLRSEWRKSFRNCIRASRKNGRKDACCDCDTPGQTEISVVSLRSSLVPNSIGSHIAIQVLGHSLGARHGSFHLLLM